MGKPSVLVTALLLWARELTKGGSDWRLAYSVRGLVHDHGGKQAVPGARTVAVSFISFSTGNSLSTED